MPTNRWLNPGKSLYFFTFQGAQVKAIKQPLQVTQGAMVNCILHGWPTEPATIQAFVKQAKTVAMPVQNFQFIAAAIAKNKQVWRKGVQLQYFLDVQ
jgi:hypothetical protein